MIPAARSTDRLAEYEDLGDMERNLSISAEVSGRAAHHYHGHNRRDQADRVAELRWQFGLWLARIMVRECARRGLLVLA